MAGRSSGLSGRPRDDLIGLALGLVWFVFVFGVSVLTIAGVADVDGIDSDNTVGRVISACSSR